jgi:hypothetical protein
MTGNNTVFDISALVYVVLIMVQNNASLKTNTYLRPDAINEVSH